MQQIRKRVNYKIKWNEHQFITLCVSMKNCNQWLVYAKHPFIWMSFMATRVEWRGEAFKVMGDAWAFMALFYDWKPSKLITLNLFFAFNCSLSNIPLSARGGYILHTMSVYMNEDAHVIKEPFTVIIAIESFTHSTWLNLRMTENRMEFSASRLMCDDKVFELKKLWQIT